MKLQISFASLFPEETWTQRKHHKIYMFVLKACSDLLNVALITVKLNMCIMFRDGLLFMGMTGLEKSDQAIQTICSESTGH